VPPEAQWCSLCFADLREPVPVPVPVAVAANGAAAAASVNADALLGLPERPAEPLASDLLTEGDDRPAEGGDAPIDGKGAVTWPCHRCGEQVEMSLDSCPSCGTGFLAGSTAVPSTRLPVVGDIGRMSRTQRLVVGFVIAVVVMIILVVLATIGGHIL
jgi:hypothetical protein